MAHKRVIPPKEGKREGSILSPAPTALAGSCGQIETRICTVARVGLPVAGPSVESNRVRAMYAWQPGQAAGHLGRCPGPGRCPGLQRTAVTKKGKGKGLTLADETPGPPHFIRLISAWCDVLRKLTAVTWSCLLPTSTRAEQQGGGGYSGASRGDGQQRPSCLCFHRGRRGSRFAGIPGPRPEG